MSKQHYVLSIIIAFALALAIAGCSAPSINTAANLSNKTNSNYPPTNSNSPVSGNNNANSAVATPTIK